MRPASPSPAPWAEEAWLAELRGWAPQADVWLPSRRRLRPALTSARTLAIGAHPDDVEVIAADQIARRPGDLIAVVVTDGAGSPRRGRFQGYTADQMAAVRRREQRRAAGIAGYAALVQLGFSSAEVRGSDRSRVSAALGHILAATRLDRVYAHQPTDRHDTHVAVFWRTWEALRARPRATRPPEFLGVEVWRGLDWASAEDVRELPVAATPTARRRHAALWAAFQSQVAGGKRYDRAVAARRVANATFRSSHAVDAAAEVNLALDLGPLLALEAEGVSDWARSLVERLARDVTDRLQRMR